MSHSRIAYAATVRDHAPHLLDAVIAGGMGLDEAYKKAREIKTAADSTDAQIARLRAEDSELADRVVEGELTLKAAWVEREARVEEDKRQRRVATGLLDTLHTVAGMAGAGTGVRYEPEYVATGRPITAEVIDLARRAIDEIEAALKERDLL